VPRLDREVERRGVLIGWVERQHAGVFARSLDIRDTHLASFRSSTVWFRLFERGFELAAIAGAQMRRRPPGCSAAAYPNRLGSVRPLDAPRPERHNYREPLRLEDRSRPGRGLRGNSRFLRSAGHSGDGYPGQQQRAGHPAAHSS
jgi:hypothetical protein